MSEFRSDPQGTSSTNSTSHSGREHSIADDTDDSRISPFTEQTPHSCDLSYKHDFHSEQSSAKDDAGTDIVSGHSRSIKSNTSTVHPPLQSHARRRDISHDRLEDVGPPSASSMPKSLTFGADVFSTCNFSIGRNDDPLRPMTGWVTGNRRIGSGHFSIPNVKVPQIVTFDGYETAPPSEYDRGFTLVIPDESGWRIATLTGIKLLGEGRKYAHHRADYSHISRPIPTAVIGSVLDEWDTIRSSQSNNRQG